MMDIVLVIIFLQLTIHKLRSNHNNPFQILFGQGILFKICQNMKITNLLGLIYADNRYIFKYSYKVRGWVLII